MGVWLQYHQAHWAFKAAMDEWLLFLLGPSACKAEMGGW